MEDFLNWKSIVQFSHSHNNDYNSGTEKVVFLTGATGFLGGFILSDLLKSTNYHIWCLVRAADVDSGMVKLKANLESLGILDENYLDRIKVCYLCNFLYENN